MSSQSSTLRTPPGFTWLQSLQAMFTAHGNPLGLFVDAARRYGDVVHFGLGPISYLLVNDLDGIRHVLVDNYRNYVKSRNYDGLKLILGNGLVTSEGEFWRRQRKLMQPAFHREQLAALAGTMAGATADLLERWDGTGPGPVDIHAEMLRLTLRIVGQTLFAVDIEGQAAAIGKSVEVLNRYANDYVQHLVRTPVWLPTPANRRFRQALRGMDEMALRLIAERRQRPEGPAGGGDLLTMLVAATDEETRDGMSDRQLRDEILTLMAAGHETTANGLSWTFYLLAQHPEVERRLHNEAAEVLGGRPATFADLPRLRYTSMVLQEAMRLYPPVWVIEREALADDEVCGYTVPKGTIVVVSPYTLHRRPALWEDPEVFDPERFAPERAAARPRYAYLPFGGGPRQCIGNHFAMMEAQIILAMIARRYRLRLVPEHPIALEPLVTLRPRHGIRATLEAQPGPPRAALAPEPVAATAA